MHAVVVPVQGSGDEPQHEHADLRFALATARPEKIEPEHPDAALRWLTLDEARELTAEESVRETMRRVERLLAVSAVARRPPLIETQRV